MNKLPFTSLKDLELIDLAFNSNFTCPCQKTCTNVDNHEILKTLDLCKLNLSEHDPLYGNDINSHVNFHSNFDYYTIHKFHKLVKNLSLKNGKLFSLMHTNISSLLGNVEKLEDILVDLTLNFDVIALSETWHTKANNDRFKNLTIPGFHEYKGLVGSSKNGGCGLFIRDDLYFKLRPDLNRVFVSKSCEFEAFWLEIENKTGANVVTGIIYNHPRKDSSEFIEYLGDTLRKLTKENKLVIISGDFNLDLLAFEKKPIVEEFLNTIFASFLQPVILNQQGVYQIKNHHSLTIFS